MVEHFELIDYRVRILDQGHGTDATVRVLIQTTDGQRAWTTVGVGQNIIEASWEALSDAYLYGLIHAAPVEHFRADARPARRRRGGQGLSPRLTGPRTASRPGLSRRFGDEKVRHGQ